MIKKPILDENGKPSLPYDRFIVAGCSFTQYAWPTWADILAYNFGCTKGQYLNIAQPGAGNQFISSQVLALDAVDALTSNDCVVVCWSGVSRYDTYHDDKGWLAPGDIVLKEGISYADSNDKDDIRHTSSFIKKYYDPVGFLFRDLVCMQSIKQLLDNRNVDYLFLTMQGLPLTDIQPAFEKSIKQLVEVFSDTIQTVTSRPSLHDALTKHIENNYLVHPDFHDTHPLPGPYIEYIEQYIYELDIPTQKYIDTIHNQIVKIIQDQLDKKIDYDTKKFGYRLHELTVNEGLDDNKTNLIFPRDFEKFNDKQ